MFSKINTHISLSDNDLSQKKGYFWKSKEITLKMGKFK